MNFKGFSAFFPFDQSHFFPGSQWPEGANLKEECCCALIDILAHFTFMLEKESVEKIALNAASESFCSFKKCPKVLETLSHS